MSLADPIADGVRPAHSSPAATAWAVYRFGRLSAVSFTLLVPLVGAATAWPTLPWPEVGGLLGTALAFHVFAYVVNDVVDLPLDRTEPLRADSPLVRGVIAPATALGVALVQLPGLVAWHWWLDGGPMALATLGLAVLPMVVYDVWGKRIRVALVADAVQGVSWSALAMYGALVTGRPPTTASIGYAVIVFVYVLLVNGVHGGLRDLDNDGRSGARTTALAFGAGLDALGRIRVPAAFIAYGAGLHLLLFSVAWWCVLTNATGLDGPGWTVTVACLLVLQATQTWLAIRALRAATPRPALIRLGIVHLLLSLASTCLPFMAAMGPAAATATAAAYLVPNGVLLWHDGVWWL